LVEARGRSAGSEGSVSFDMEDEPQAPSNIIISPDALQELSSEE
jgi:hypothetical protein